MALQKVLVPITFSGGLDTKTASKQVIPGKLLELQNVIFEKGGELKKRWGYDRLGNFDTNSDQLTTGAGITTFEKELLINSNNKLYSYLKSIDKWADKGSLYSVFSKIESIVKNDSEQTVADCALINGVYVYAWEDSRGGVRASVIDAETGTYLQADVLVKSSAVMPKCVVINNAILITYIVSGTMYGRIIHPSNRTVLGTEFTIVSDVASGVKTYDSAAYGYVAVISYQPSSGGIKTLFVLLDGTIGNGSNGYAAPVQVANTCDTALSISINDSTGYIHIGFVGGGFLNALTFDSGLNIMTPVTGFDTGVTVNQLTTAILDNKFYMFTEKMGATFPYIDLYESDLSYGSQSDAVFARSVGLGSKAFKKDSQVYVSVIYPTDIQGTYFTLSLDKTIVTKTLYENAGGLLPKPLLPNFVLTPDGSLTSVYRSKSQLVSEGGVLTSILGLSKVELIFDSPDAFNSVKMGRNLYISGGFLQNYDSAGIVENGFHLYPEDFSSAAATSGGSIVASGTSDKWQYVLVYEWTDNKGQIHRSAPSLPVTDSFPSATTAGQFHLTIPYLRLTAKKNPRSEVAIVIYRTEKNGSLFYRVTPVSSPLFNNVDASAEFFDYYDTMSDADLIKNQLLYTTGGVLENISPSSTSILTTFKNRLVLAGLEDPNMIAFSKTFIEGECSGFNPVVTARVDSIGGEITALAELDDKLIIFKKNNIFVLAGDGPNNLGTNDNFSIPERVNTDVGCSNQASISLTPDGLIFKSSKGIYLLDRSLNSIYIGAEVEKYNSLEVTSSKLLQDSNAIIFTLADGPALYYNYFFRQWGTFTNHEAVGSAVFEDKYCFLKSDGKVYLQNTSKYLDGGNSYNMKIKTAWLKVNGLQGFQRVYRASFLGDYKSKHKLQVKMAFDYRNYFQQEYTKLFDPYEVLGSEYYGEGEYGVESPMAGPEDGVYQFQIHIGHQKCQAIMFEITDVLTTNIGASFTLNDLTLEIGVKRGLNKVGIAKK